MTNADTDIPEAIGSTYTVAREDRDRAIKVRVDFTDDGGNYETLTSFALMILPPVNSPAAGAPVVNGSVRVGETLTVDTSAVSDDDGMTNAAFTYQWIRSEGATVTDIENATSASYTLVDADVGNTIRARVSFTDDAGNPETLTSQATAAVTGGERAEEPEPVQQTEEGTQAHETPEPPRNLTATVNPDGSVSLNGVLMFSDSVLPNWPAKMSDHGDINVDAERTGKTSGAQQPAGRAYDYGPSGDSSVLYPKYAGKSGIQASTRGVAGAAKPRRAGALAGEGRGGRLADAPRGMVKARYHGSTGLRHVLPTSCAKSKSLRTWHGDRVTRYPGTLPVTVILRSHLSLGNH